MKVITIYVVFNQKLIFLFLKKKKELNLVLLRLV